MSYIHAAAMASQRRGRPQPWPAGAPHRRPAVEEHPAALGGARVDVSRMPVDPSERPVPSVARRGLSAVHEVLRSSGQRLAPAVRSLMEARFGQDFGHVQVHTDAVAARTARQLGARAYTVGNHVVFGTGQLDLGSASGFRLAAHELAHVIQQGGSDGAPPTAQHLTISDSGDAAEREADRAAETVHRPLSRPALGAEQTRHGQAVIQRFESYEHVQLGDTGGLPGGGLIVLEAHRRDLPGHASPTAGWPAEWVSLWAKGTPDQQRAIRDGLTYGEVVALAGDLYASVKSSGTTDIGESVERLNHASLREI
jgi:Domain of unknown function (DUF4157)